MEKLYFDTLKETLFHKKMSNGLEVYLLQKNGFEKTYGLFSTNFGSIDTSFVPINSNELIKVEDGIAHFLEHKMFDMKNGDASDEFAKLGANTNAFTSSSRTAYQFTTTENVNECVSLLIDFVQSLDITSDSVEKEKGIIIQEINMYDDDPDWRVYFGSIQNLYIKHPVRVDIAGTSKTVNATTKEMLELCYETFYHPSNMMLFIVGNINPIELMEFIELNQNKKSFKKEELIQLENYNEPDSIYKSEDTLLMDVDMNKIIMSIKINEIITDSKLKLKRELAINFLFDYFFSKSSDLYNDWLSKGIINSTFGATVTQERDYAFIQMGGDVDDVKSLEIEMKKFVANINNFIIDKFEFERIKKKNIGIFINAFNSPEGIANLFSRYYFEKIIAMDIVDIVNEITIDDLNRCKKYFKEEFSSVFIVKKK